MMCLVVLLLMLGASALVAHGASYQVTVLIVPADAGHVVGDGQYQTGEPVQLVAVPNTGFEFVRWTEEDVPVSADSIYSFVADRHRILTARFVSRAESMLFSGTWSGGLTVLPGFSLDTQRFDLQFVPQPGPTAWRARMSTSISGDGTWNDLQFGGSGRLGDIQLSTGLTFNPSASAYRSAYAALQWTGQGMTLGFRADHTAMGGSPPGPYLLYTWTLRSGSVSLTARLDETCDDGAAFRDITAQFTGIEVCCGISARGTVSISRDGFDYLRLSVSDLPVSDALSLDLQLMYTLDGKELTWTPRLAPFCTSCFTLYGDFELGKLDLDGLKIRCCLDDIDTPDCPDCSSSRCPPGSRVGVPYVEYVTATNPSKVPAGFKGAESSYLKFGSCGEGCCGGAFDLELAAFFAPTGGLFGLTRIVGYIAVPWTESLRWEIDAEFSLVGDDTSFKIGWDYRF
jgi:hypothetical protein